MKALRRFVRRLAATLFGRRDDDRVRDELAEHLTLLTEEYLRAGFPLDEARRRARLRLGAGDAIAEAYRDEQRLGWLEDLARDLLYAVRSLRRNPGFSAVAIVTLALGMGANLAIFAFVNAVLIRPLPYREPAELTLVHLLMPERDAPGVYRQSIWSYPKYEVVRDGQQVFTATSLFTDTEWTLTSAGDPERVQGEIVEAAYFTLLGVEAGLGRLFSGDDDRVDATPVAVISHGLWQRRFGAASDVLGKMVTLDGTAATIVGVAPAGFRGLSGRADVWRPFKPTVPFDLNEPFSHSYYQIARRRPGVSVEQADAAVRVLGRQIDTAFPMPRAVGQTGVKAVALNDERIDPLSIFAGLALVLALVGVFAVLAQSVAQRTREIGVRMALGAAPRDIQRLVLGRAVEVAAAGVVAGLCAAWFTSRLLTTFLYDVEPADPAVLSAIALLLFAVTLVASFVPARRAAHVDPLETIRSE